MSSSVLNQRLMHIIVNVLFVYRFIAEDYDAECMA